MSVALAGFALASLVVPPTPAGAATLDPKVLAARQLYAQAPTPGQPVDTGTGTIAEVSRTLNLQAGTGTLLHLPRAPATVMSAEPGIARVQPVSPTTLFVMGVARGRTTIIATSDTGEIIGQYDVTVTPGAAAEAPAPLPVLTGPIGAVSKGVTPAAAREIQLSVHRMVPGAQSVGVEAIGGRLLLRGAVPNAAAAEQVEAIARGVAGDDVGMVDTMVILGSIQVNVRVRIAEIDRTITRQLGFNWQVLGNASNWRFGLLTGAAAAVNATVNNFPGPIPGSTVSSLPGSVINPSLPLGLSPFMSAPSSPFQIGGGYSSSKWDINGVIDALAADQLVTILAEPNLTAQSGETASFLAGGEFPIPVAGNATNGGTTITVEFKQFGVSLSLVPTVLSPRRLNLRIRPEVSQLSSAGAVSVPVGNGTLTIPALTVRRAETTVELGSGQSFAIAGLLQRTSADITSALPGIGEVPVIGALFKSNNFQRGDSELVIIVTPYLVRPVSEPEDMHLPTDNFRPANDAERMLYGRQMATPAAGQGVPNAGFMLK